MASALVAVQDLKTALGEPGNSLDQLYEQVIERVQAAFEGACNRHERPFVGAQLGRTEVHDATGTDSLWLQYPIQILTSVVLGYDPALPDETLDIADKQVLVYGVGSRRLVRVDGKRFGFAGRPRYIHVAYAAEADLPAAAKAAVLAGSMLIVNRLGSEGVSAERIGAYSVDYTNIMGAEMANDPLWQLGVSACWEPRL